MAVAAERLPASPSEPRASLQPATAARPSRPRSAPIAARTSARTRSSTAYREMLLIRRFEEKAGQMYGMGLIGGFCHLYIGQEAVVVGMQMATSEGDQVITGYRDHGHMLACGMDPKGVMAELTGRRGGYPRARAARCTCSASRSTFTAATASSARRSRSAPGWPSPTAIASNDNVCLTYFGDGAANQGQVYESFNMAELWKLPVVYVIENNRYAMGTSVDRASAQTDFSKRGLSFNIPGEQVDGMDVRAVKAAGDSAPCSGAATARARTSWKCRPTAIAATRCPTRPSTARRTKSQKMRERARSDRAGPRAGCSRPGRRRRRRAEGDRRQGARDRQRGGGIRHA